jgi:hypothetical protein
VYTAAGCNATVQSGATFTVLFDIEKHAAVGVNRLGFGSHRHRVHGSCASVFVGHVVHKSLTRHNLHISLNQLLLLLPFQCNGFAVHALNENFDRLGIRVILHNVSYRSHLQCVKFFCRFQRL